MTRREACVPSTGSIQSCGSGVGPPPLSGSASNLTPANTNSLESGAHIECESAS